MGEEENHRSLVWSKVPKMAVAEQAKRETESFAQIFDEGPIIIEGNKSIKSERVGVYVQKLRKAVVDRADQANQKC